MPFFPFFSSLPIHFLYLRIFSNFRRAYHPIKGFTKNVHQRKCRQTLKECMHFCQQGLYWERVTNVYVMNSRTFLHIRVEMLKTWHSDTILSVILISFTFFWNFQRDFCVYRKKGWRWPGKWKVIILGVKEKLSFILPIIFTVKAIK